MATQAETEVLRLLSAIEVEPEDAAKAVLDLGDEAVTVLCEAALGSFPGLRAKVRTNAVALLGWVKHPQAQEATRLLIRDPNPDVSIRALRAVGRQKNSTITHDLGRMLQNASLPPLVAAEVVKALIAIDSPESRKALSAYDIADPKALPHRGSELVAAYLQSRPH